MTEPYTPKASTEKHQAGVNAYYAKLGITQELKRERMPLGGYGFRWVFYRHGEEIPNGIQGL